MSLHADSQRGRIEMVDGDDGALLMSRRWAVGKPRARVVFVHGIVSHSGWYLASCDALANASVDVRFLDRRGSGGNPDRRGDVSDWRLWIDDLVCFLESQPRDVPLVLGGISWGGKLAAVLAAERPDLLDGLALICPGIHAAQFPSPAKYAILGGLARAGLARLRVPIPLKDPSLFTGVQRWQEFIRKDSLTLRKVSVRFALEDRKLTRRARAIAEKISVPSWLVLAGKDRIVDNEETRAWFDRTAGVHREVTCYDNAAHTFEFEPDPRTYFRDLVGWVTRLGESAGD
ncbi:alpha/beta hydrolase [Rhodopirellula sp. JC740]|uniref:Alpha/beta hydrolase n=1 Tax=Rhodopirellula halodulae TaxID=2894198 RepID=A0ABS8NGS3_9BACT|nr:alpha/beta fold hydrolase [Rhodopirellula sp. JC740]MCC9642754.1 alpha/beta hydrolase [Rhodopirellula sp. JC740]